VFHLAAVLSRKAEHDPDLAHWVNVDGTVGLLRLCDEAARRAGRPVRFLFPSSIAIYGLPDAATRQRCGAIRESEWTIPAGMYGCNKLYGELVGAYMSRRAAAHGEPGIDFRAIRFPGLISADTLPTGGTTDYAAEMIHAAAQGTPYRCFVRPDTRLPFMTMPDATEALLSLAEAPSRALSTRVYNVRAFSPSAGEIRQAVLGHFPGAEIDFGPDPERQAIVDTWPADVDDTLARRDWGFCPRHDLALALRDYLVPALRSRYAAEPTPHPSGPSSA
jgi:nucleoside-diphosphate-sugar epimerase